MAKGNQVNVKSTFDASGFTAGVRKMQKSIKSSKAELKTLASGFAAVGLAAAGAVSPRKSLLIKLVFHC